MNIAMTKPMRESAARILELEDGLVDAKSQDTVSITEPTYENDKLVGVSFKPVSVEYATDLLKLHQQELRAMLKEAHQPPGDKALDALMDSALNELADTLEQGQGSLRRSRDRGRT